MKGKRKLRAFLAMLLAVTMMFQQTSITVLAEDPSGYSEEDPQPTAAPEEETAEPTATPIPEATQEPENTVERQKHRFRKRRWIMSRI